MKTIYVHPNEQKPNIREAVSEVCTLLRGRGERVLVSAAYFDPALPGVTYCPAEEAIPQAAFAVSLGGDGTMLRLSRLAARSQVPIIGVNLGHVGFMTELERDEIPLLGRVLDGNFTCDDRMMLRLTVLRGGRAVFTCDALNDIALVRGTPMFHVVHIDVEADGTRVAAFSGDGVVFATPTGSTAYSLSAGGPIVEPSTENIVLTPVCAHGFQPGSFIFSARRRLSIHARCGHSAGLCVSGDGDQDFPLLPGDEAVVERSPLQTRLLRVKGHSFYHILQQKLIGRDEP
ncbi:NAD(+)/NADH kinase [Clostridiaceae bacterium]|nr:NAD(+)/NADH kinase [Eubacteriales bacterium]NBH79654.1 NAD(+)/NADH kinase [Clostridiaceae bacterium]